MIIRKDDMGNIIIINDGKRYTIFTKIERKEVWTIGEYEPKITDVVLDLKEEDLDDN